MLSEFEKAVLNAVQKDIPIAPRPFAVLAERLRTDEETLLGCLARLKRDGYIRRFGALCHLLRSDRDKVTAGILVS